MVSRNCRMPVSSHFTILYGSQTGQAQAVAEEIHENSTQHGLQCNLFCLSETEKKFTLENEPLVVFVVSTTGEGDPPDNMLKFFRRLKKKTLPRDHLKHCQYTLLALGDTNYTNFCNNGKNLDRRLLALGAKHFYNTGYADDAVGLEIVIDPWINGLWEAVKKCIGLDTISHGILDSNGIMDGTCDHEEDSNTNNSNVHRQSPMIEHLEGNQVSTVASEKSNMSESKSTGVASIETTASDVTSTVVNEKSNKSENKSTVVASAETTASDVTSTVVNEKSNMNENKSTVVASAETTASDVTSTVNFVNEMSNMNETTTTDPSQATLRKSIEPLSSSALSIPLLSAPYLTVEYDETHSTSQNDEDIFFHSSQSTMATILSAKTLTSVDSVKTTLEIELDVTDCGLDYEPGDSFDVICNNSETEVEELIQILGLNNKADLPFVVSIMPSTTKKVAVKPSHIPEPCTIRDVLLHCLEIRAVPKKAMLRMLVEYTDNEQEKRRLQELCSKQGTADYQTVIRAPSTSLLELLKAFPSCHPPFERLLEHLPKVSPRPYSVASSPLTDPNSLKFVFNIIEFPPFEDLHSDRQGVCTRWLSKATSSMRDQYSLVDGMTKLQVDDQAIKVPVAARKKTEFKLPKDPKTPVIMVGPGTGVAPFKGFLDHRKLGSEGKDPREVFGPTWLFYGCRNSNKDYLYKDELQSYCSSGILTNLLVAFSREEGCTIRYVQDNLRLHSKEVSKMLFEDNAIVYVCGDAKNMAKDVFATFCEIIEQHLGISKVEAVKEMAKLRAKKQYHEDVWT